MANATWPNYTFCSSTAIYPLSIVRHDICQKNIPTRVFGANILHKKCINQKNGKCNLTKLHLLLLDGHISTVHCQAWYLSKLFSYQSFWGQYFKQKCINQNNGKCNLTKLHLLLLDGHIHCPLSDMIFVKTFFQPEFLGPIIYTKMHKSE